MLSCRSWRDDYICAGSWEGGRGCMWSHKMTSHLHCDRKCEQQTQEEFYMTACVGSDCPIWIFVGFFSSFLFLFHFFAFISLKCQCDCWRQKSSWTGKGFDRSKIVFLFKWKWHIQKTSVALKNWKDSKWLEGVWHRMWRETLLFLLPVSSTAVCKSDNIPLPVSVHVLTWRAHPSSGHTADLMTRDLRNNNTPVKFYFKF